MRLLLIDHIKTAVHSLKTTRTRTLLTTLGIAIGVASVTIILSLSHGITSVIDRQVRANDNNLAVVRPGTDSTTSFASPIMQQSFATSTLSENDITDIENLSHASRVAPLMLLNGSMSADTTTLKNRSIVATTPDFSSTSNLEVREGQFIDAVTNMNTAVVGPQLSVDLFGTEESIGKIFSIRGERFTVIGILKRANQPFNYNNVDLDTSAIISLESGKKFHNGTAQIQQINLRADNQKNLEKLVASAEKKLVKNHDGEKDFTILTGEQITRPTSNVFTTIAIVMTIIAAISLLVGGIGIMNIMLVGVAERTREIGLRKAVGASNAALINQFLIESLIISMLGGLLGYVAGYAIAFTISAFLTFSPAFTWQIAAIAFGISIVVGTLFGLYPAIRAARKDAIESLRQYR